MAAAAAAAGTLVAVGFGLWFARCKVARGWLNPEPDTLGNQGKMALALVNIRGKTMAEQTRLQSMG